MNNMMQQWKSPPISWRKISDHDISEQFLCGLDHQKVFFRTSNFPNYRQIEHMDIITSENNLSNKSKVQHVFISNKFSDIYYHWVFDIIPLVSYSAQVFGSNAVLYVPYIKHRFQSDWINLIKPLASWVASAHEAFIDQGTCLVPSKSTTGTIPSPWAVRQVQSLASGIKPNHRFKKIYLKRSGEISRKIVNEPELERILSSRGFISLDMALLSVEDQISIFKGANCIVSAHGSGLANIVFCAPGAKVVEIFGPRCGETCYPRLAFLCNIKHIGVQADALSYFTVKDRFRHYLDLASAPFHFRANLETVVRAVELIENE
jgi:hypothetical protein